MHPSIDAEYEYIGQQSEHRGKRFRYCGFVTEIQDRLPVLNFLGDDDETLTLAESVWQRVMRQA
jgi:hypothetical protein